MCNFHMAGVGDYENEVTFFSPSNFPEKHIVSKQSS